ncbi:MAG: helix-turn-helix transcriptional regulator [Woeseiaceae bacterium]|nr:helix-turn-helix transcriptional regulator [Woeseiaceae bacterium]
MSEVQFGTEIRRRRESRGWTQEQFATRADLSVRFVQSLESGAKMPSLESLFKISLAFGTSPGILLEPMWRDWRE